jgi:hypothetical protein
VIEAGQHILEALHALFDCQVLMLRFLAVLHFERQLALLQPEKPDQYDCDGREAERPPPPSGVLSRYAPFTRLSTAPYSGPVDRAPIQPWTPA